MFVLMLLNSLILWFLTSDFITSLGKSGGLEQYKITYGFCIDQERHRILETGIRQNKRWKTWTVYFDKDKLKIKIITEFSQQWIAPRYMRKDSREDLQRERNISDNHCYKLNLQLYALIAAFLLAKCKDVLFKPMRIIYISQKYPQICF